MTAITGVCDKQGIALRLKFLESEGPEQADEFRTAGLTDDENRRQTAGSDFPVGPDLDRP